MQGSFFFACVVLVILHLFTMDLTSASGFQKQNLIRNIGPASFHLRENGLASEYLFHGTEVNQTVLQIAELVSREIFLQPVSMLTSEAPLPNISRACQEDVNQLTKDFTSRQPYALQMIDAFAKPNSGLLRGSWLWLGAYDECVSAGTPHANFSGRSFKGHYAFLYFKDLVLIPNSQFALTAAVCLPDSCSDIDISLLAYKYLAKYKLIGYGVSPQSRSLSKGAIATIVVLGLIGTLVLLGTLADLLLSVRCSTQKTAINSDLGDPNERTGLLANHSPNDGIYHTHGSSHNLLSGNGDNVKIASNQVQREKCQFLLTFSLLSNTKKLLSTSTASGQLASVNGMRVLSMWWVILGHTFVFAESMLDNLVEGADLLKRWTFQPILNGTFSVDTFFFMSGLLVAYITLKKMRENNNRLSFWGLFYFHRFWRLTPTYGLVILIWTTLLMHMVKGPFQIFLNDGQGYAQSIETCRTKWWTNLLYINNFYPYWGDVNQQCLGWSWYLANDMQFFIISPLFLILLHKWRPVGVIFVGLGIVSCVIARAVTVYELGTYLPNYQTPTKHMSDYALGSRPLYDKPYTRIAPYLVGMLVGYFLQKTDCRIRLNKIFVLIGWCVAIVCGLSVTYGLLDYYVHPHQGSMFASLAYISLGRLAWAIACAWVIIACATGYGGLVNSILSWRVWGPLGRLTYCAYLIHPVVIFYLYLNLKSTIHYDDHQIIYFYTGNLVMSYLAAYVLSMIVEAPMLGLGKLVLKLPGKLRRVQ